MIYLHVLNDSFLKGRSSTWDVWVVMNSPGGATVILIVEEGLFLYVWNNISENVIKLYFL